jgi:hypothetical protein
MQGTYTDTMGAYVLDLKSGGEATFAFAGEAAPCSYRVNGQQLVLDCKGGPGKTTLTIHDGGFLLSGPPGLMPPLRTPK